MEKQGNNADQKSIEQGAARWLLLLSTGGKDNEGPDIETIAKIIMKPLAEGKDQRVIHYNHEIGINLWKELNKEKAIQLLNNHHTQLNTDNTHEFEY